MDVDASATDPEVPDEVALSLLNVFVGDGLGEGLVCRMSSSVLGTISE